MVADPVTIAIVEKLIEVAAKVGGIVLNRRKGQIEKDKEDLCMHAECFLIASKCCRRCCIIRYWQEKLLQSSFAWASRM